MDRMAQPVSSWMSAKIQQIQLRLMGKGETIWSGPAGPLASLNAATKDHLTTVL